MRRLVSTLIAMILLGVPQQARAQSEALLEVDVLAVQIEFAERITFQSRIRSPLPIAQALIFIQDNFDGITRSQPVQVGQDGVVFYSFENIRGILQPFTVLTFWYEATLQNGQKAASGHISVRYIDNRFSWQTISDDLVRVHWHTGDGTYGQALLAAAKRGLEGMDELFPARTGSPVDIYVYASPEQLNDTFARSGRDWTGAHARPRDGLVLAAIPPGPRQGVEMEMILPHELAHVILYRNTGAGYKNLPAWLREGLASQAELYPDPDYTLALSTASRDNLLIPITELCDSFPVDESRARLAYAESASFIRFLLDTYGTSNLLALISAYVDGLGCEQAPQRVLGVSLEQLDVHWREQAFGENAAGIFMRTMGPFLFILGMVLLIPLLGVLRRRSHDRK